MTNPIDLFIDFALSQDGVREQGDNGGPQVTKYLSSVGLAPPDAWCAAFMYYCALHSLPAVPPPWPRTGQCETIRQWAKRHFALRTSPQRGDLFLRIGYVTDDGVRTYRAHHTGLVTEVNHDDNSISTVEGNTNNWGGREGVGVFQLKRTINPSSLVYVRWVAQYAPPPPLAPPSPWSILSTKGTFLLSNTLLSLDSQGHIVVPIRAFGEALGFKVAWDSSAQAPTYNGQLIPVECSWRKDSTYAPLVDLLHSVGLSYAVDDATRTIRVVRV